MPVRTNCPVCNASNSEVFIDGEDLDLALPNVGSSRTVLCHGKILRCRACSFSFRQLRPDDSELASLYREASDDVYENEMPGRLQTARTYARLIQRHVRQPGSILDVGCASGAFLLSMADCGWQVSGVEPSKSQFLRAERILHGRGNLFNCTLQEANLPGGYDVLTMWDVLEHVTDPVGFMRKCSSMVRQGGWIALKVPDIDALQARLLGKRWPLLLAEHLNYFNRTSLQICGERAGLRSVWFGRRPVHFSAKYVVDRLSQHRVPGSAAAQKLLSRCFIERGKLLLPIWMGELVAVWQRPLSAS